MVPCVGVREFGNLHKNFTHINRGKRCSKPVTPDIIDKEAFYMATRRAKIQQKFECFRVCKENQTFAIFGVNILNIVIIHKKQREKAGEKMENFGGSDICPS